MRIVPYVLLVLCAGVMIYVRFAYPLPADRPHCERIGDPVTCAECAFATQKGGK